VELGNRPETERMRRPPPKFWHEVGTRQRAWSASVRSMDNSERVNNREDGKPAPSRGERDSGRVPRLQDEESSQSRRGAQLWEGSSTVVVGDTNRGSRTGADVVEGYVQDPSSTGEPPEQLRAFSKVTLAPGSTTRVKLTFRPSSFAYWDSGAAAGITPQTTSPSAPGVDNSTQPGGQWTIAPGQYTISVGGSSTQFDDSTRIHLTGNTQAGQLTGLFGWSRP